MTICKIDILNVELVKSNLATRQHYRLKLSTRKTLSNTNDKQLAAPKKQLKTYNFISNWQNKFTTRKITLQIV